MSERLDVEVLVVGAGPAGLAAAVAAGSKLARVLLVDENPVAGGQIWRAMGKEESSPTHGYLSQLFKARVQILTPATVIDFPSSTTALLLTNEGPRIVEFRKAVLATGARELFLPFPGWTVPGVCGVGGLQALVRQGLPIRGKRIVVAGTGPLLLAVGKHLIQNGAELVGFFEQAPPGNVRQLARALWRHPSKFRQAAGFWSVARKLEPGWWVESALGKERLESVKVTNGSHGREISCDYLACAYGLIPNTQLARIAGCRIDNGFVVVDEYQRSSEDRIFCAGELVEIGGVEAAIEQGSIAGLAAVGAVIHAKDHFHARKKASAFARDLERAFPIRTEVRQLANAETIICRCEDVRRGQIENCNSFKEAKLQTRLGMGPCQGRICGAACQVLFGWEEPSVRPPVVPVPIRALTGTSEIYTRPRV